MQPEVYYVLHVVAGFLLFAWTFQAFAAPDPEKKVRIAMLTGIASLIMVVAGFGLQAKLKTGFPVWLLVKVFCWLVLSALSGMAFRQPQRAKAFSLLAILVTATAVLMVYLKPA